MLNNALDLCVIEDVIVWHLKWQLAKFITLPDVSYTSAQLIVHEQNLKHFRVSEAASFMEWVVTILVDIVHLCFNPACIRLMLTFVFLVH